MEAKAFGSRSSYQGVCERHGKEDSCVTWGRLMRSAKAVRDSISEGTKRGLKFHEESEDVEVLEAQEA